MSRRPQPVQAALVLERMFCYNGWRSEAIVLGAADPRPVGGGMTTLREVAIFTNDVDRAADFYAALLGSAPTARWPGGALFTVGGTVLLIHARSPAGPDGPPNEDHIAFGVPDLDAASATLTAVGRPPLLAARTYDWGRSAYLRDPDGRLVELAERA